MDDFVPRSIYDVIDQFRNALIDTGFNPPKEIIADGKRHRFSPDGRPSHKPGWYVLHSDYPPTGIYGDWRTGEKHKWHARLHHRLTQEERDEYRRRLQNQKTQHEAKEAKIHAEARLKAEEIWSKAQPATDDHPYLKRKGVKSYGLRCDTKDRLIVPVMKDGKLHSIQYIHPDGTKEFLYGGRVQGCSFMFPGSEQPICFGEGYSTSATIHQASGHTVVMVFNVGNLLPVISEFRKTFPDTRFVICADDDVKTKGNPGLTKARQAAEEVGGFVAVPDFGAERPDGATDFNDMAAHFGLEAVQTLIQNADKRSLGHPNGVPLAIVKPNGKSIEDEEAEAIQAERAGQEEPWPRKLAKEALYGLTGEVIALLLPQCEADQVALVMQFLVSFGNAVGRKAYYYVAKTRHYPNIFAVLVGQTGQGRKGTAQAYIESLFNGVEPEWLKDCNKSGLSSGEGLIWAVRDAAKEDPGVNDKRLLVTEEEFGGTLRLMKRDGNILSPIIRKAWDKGNLSVLTKNAPVRATNAHISIVGHITPTDLRQNLDNTEAANGFGNRFLWTAVRRSKFLADGGNVEDDDLKEIQPRLKTAIEFANKVERLPFDNDGHARWREEYRGLTLGQPGLFGAITDRAAPQVIRLALIYALLDASPVIKQVHLEAALAVWNYAKESAGLLFGDSIGDPMADEILAALKRKESRGMTRTDIRDYFGRNQSAGQIGQALQVLLKSGKVERQEIQTTGRPKEVWVATRKKEHEVTT